MQQRNFDKIPLSISKQISLLQENGLNVFDQTRATHLLSMVSYHRLSGYFKPFEENNLVFFKFKESTSFDDIWQLYVFDKDLRLLVMDALERIEIAFRTSLSNVLSLKYNAWWYLQDDIFKQSWKISTSNNLSPAQIFKNEVHSICNNKKADDGIKQYYKKYNNPSYPPSWILFENLSFGRCNSLFRYLKYNQDKKEVCKLLGFDTNIVESSFECFRYVRNLCAHHSRLWDRWFVYKPKHIKELQKVNCKPGTLKEQLVLLHLFNQVIAPSSAWHHRIFQLIEKHSQVPVELMGFQKGWKEDLFWKIE